MLNKLRRYYQQRGFVATTRFLLSRVFRFQNTLVYEAKLDQQSPPVNWRPDERLLHFSRSFDDSEITPELRTFLGGAAADENLAGVRNGDHLFVVADESDYLHRGYVFFHSRQNRIMGDVHDLPVIGYCYTAVKGRGRGLYKRALNAEMAFLKSAGHKRVLIEVEPSNTASCKGIEAAGFKLAWEVKAWIVLNLLVVQCLRNGNRNRWRALVV